MSKRPRVVDPCSVRLLASRHTITVRARARVHETHFSERSELGRRSATAKLPVAQGHEVWGTRRLWFFDEAGWLETPPAFAESTVTGMTTPRCTRAEVLS